MYINYNTHQRDIQILTVLREILFVSFKIHTIIWFCFFCSKFNVRDIKYSLRIHEIKNIFLKSTDKSPIIYLKDMYVLLSPHTSY